MKARHIIQTIVPAVLVALFVVMIQSCKSPQPIVQTETKEVLVERTITDTIVTIAPDSASIKALLECDSAGNVLIKELEEVHGKNVSLALALKNSQKGNPTTTIAVDCKQDSLQILVDKYKEELIQASKNLQEKTIEVKYIPPFVKWLAWIGAASILLAILAIALWVYKKFFLKA